MQAICNLHFQIGWMSLKASSFCHVTSIKIISNLKTKICRNREKYWPLSPSTHLMVTHFPSSHVSEGWQSFGYVQSSWTQNFLPLKQCEIQVSIIKWKSWQFTNDIIDAFIRQYIYLNVILPHETAFLWSRTLMFLSIIIRHIVFILYHIKYTYMYW